MTRRLPTDIEHGEFHLHQVKRQGNVALYAQSKKGRVISYEVILIDTRFDKKGQEFEVYPADVEWGFNAWSASDRIRADQIFSELLAKSDSAKSTPSDSLGKTHVPKAIPQGACLDSGS